jgi:hypothetical protein
MQQVSGFRGQGSRKIGVFIQESFIFTQESGFRGHLFLLSNFFYTFRKKFFLNLYLWNMEHLGT